MPAATELIGPGLLASILKGRTREVNRFCKLDGVTEPAIDMPVTGLTIDTNEMAVGPVVISTPAVDRVGDVLNPAGCRLENYQRNPVIFWEHGFSNEDGGSLPIASSKDKSGNLRIEVADDSVQAWSFFNGATLLSTQVFALIVAEAVNAASVRPHPIKTSWVQDGDAEYFFMDEWELREWSWVGIGCNQEALFKCVRDQRIEGQRIAVPLLKSLAPLVPPKQAKGAGMSLKPPADPTKTFPSKPAGKTKADGPEDEETSTEEETPAASGEEEETKVDDSGTRAEEQATDEGDEMSTAKYGAQVLSAVHAQIKQLSGALEAAMGPLENEEVKAACGEMLTMLSDSMTTIEGLYSANYSDQPKLLDAAGGEEEEAPDEEAMKSFLASGRLQVAKFHGHAARLAPLATAKNLTPVQKKIIDAHVKAMGRMEADAKSYRQSTLDAEAEKAKQAIAEAAGKVKDLLPYMRGSRATG